MNAGKKSFVIIDAYGFLFRAYYALPSLSTSYGLPIGGIYGFISILLKHLSKHLSDYLVVVFDCGTKNFRHAIYPQYKNNRPQLPEELIKQFAPLRESVQYFNIASEEVPNYEADDVIATLSEKYASQDVTVRILSADKDLLQLIGENVHVYDPIKGRNLDNKYVMEKFGVTSDKLLDALSLTGDTSDNVPGVPSIGVKTAAKLIDEFGTLDNILSNTSRITRKKCREMLNQYADRAVLSRDLISLCKTIDIEGSLEKYVHNPPNVENVKEFLDKYELMSLASKVERYYQISFGQVRSTLETADVKLEKKLSDPKEFLGKCELHGVLAMHVVTDGVTISSISIAYEEESVFTAEGENVTEFVEAIRPLLSLRSVLKIVYDAKLLMKFFPDMVAFDDLMIMSYSLDAGKREHDLASILSVYLTKTRKKVPQVSLLIKLHKVLKCNIAANRMCTVYYVLDRPLIPVIYSMEKLGIQVDIELLKKLSEDFSSAIHVLEEEICELAKHRFNIGSAKQLGHVLFERLKLDGAKKMPSGAYCTNVEVLTELSVEGVEIASKILKWRRFSKLKSTYTDALVRHACNERVHTSYSMIATVTGRIGSSNPNLQNIPIRTKEGGEIRKAFVARPGYKLISADYSQMELRILAHIADVKLFKKAFSEGLDIHYETAQQIFGGQGHDIDTELRRSAKSINFGIIYGMGASGLARSIGISKKEASEHVVRYFLSYPEIKQYMETVKAYARIHGYTSTTFGRRCFISGINSRKYTLRGIAERSAINAPIQGTAADIFKKAMIALHEELKVGKMVLQVHDELLVEVPEGDVENTARLMKKVMEAAVEFSVPMEVNVSAGKNWGEMEELNI